MVKQKKEEILQYEIQQVAESVRPAIMEGQEEVDQLTLLVEIANDVKKLKDTLVGDE